LRCRKSTAKQCQPIDSRIWWFVGKMKKHLKLMLLQQRLLQVQESDTTMSNELTMAGD
jgi:hypothetical protein